MLLLHKLYFQICLFSVSKGNRISTNGENSEYAKESELKFKINTIIQDNNIPNCTKHNKNTIIIVFCVTENYISHTATLLAIMHNYSDQFTDLPAGNSGNHHHKTQAGTDTGRNPVH